MRGINFIRGITRLEICGAEPERIINILAERDIEFWDAKAKKDFAIELSIHSKSLQTVLELNGKFGCEIRELESRGGKKLKAAARHRLSFIIFLALAVSLFAASSLFVWDISISGNERMSDAELKRRLHDCGLSCGSFWPSLSSDELKTRLMLSCEDIAWLGINIRSSRVDIVIHERKEKPEIIKNSELHNVLAKKSGIVSSLSVLEGRALCTVGDTVIKGETLISGELESELAERRFVHAMGTVKARTWYEITAKTPLFELEKTETGRTDRRLYLQIGKKRIKIFGNSGNEGSRCDKITKIHSLSFSESFSIPLGIISEKSRGFETRRFRQNEDEVIERMKRELLRELSRRIGEGEVLHQNFTVSKDEEAITLSLRAECIEDIGAEDVGEKD